MVNLLRKYQKPLMTVITFLIIVAFVWLYNGRTQFDRTGQRSYRIYDRSLSQAEVERTARRFHLARALGLNEMIIGLAGNAMSQEQAMENFVWNSYVLTHEARKLGLTPTDAEVANALKGLPALQTNGQFDPVKYQEFIQNLLMPNGFTDAQLEELVRDSLRLKRLTELVGSTIDATPAEFRALYIRNNQKSEVSLIRFALSDFTAAVTPTEEEIAKFYDDHLPSLNTDEKRTISYVKIELSEEEKKLTGKERMEALQKQSARAEEFGQAMLEPGAQFTTVAEKMGLAVKTAPEFTEADPPSDLAAVPQAPVTAFRLTEETPTSDPVETETGLLILHLDKLVPKRPLTREEARPRVVEGIKDEKGRNALTIKANETHAKIAEAMKAGKSFEDAAAEAGVKVESFPAFSAAEPAGQPFAPEIAEAAAPLPEGGLSTPVSTSEGALLVHLVRRQPVDESKLAEEQGKQLEGLRSFKRYVAFNEWLRLRLKEANPHSLQPAREKQQES